MATTIQPASFVATVVVILSVILVFGLTVNYMLTPPQKCAVAAPLPAKVEAPKPAPKESPKESPKATAKPAPKNAEKSRPIQKLGE